MQSFHEARRTTLKLASQFMGLDSDEDEDAVEIDDVDGVEQVWSITHLCRKHSLALRTFVKEPWGYEKISKEREKDWIVIYTRSGH